MAFSANIPFYLNDYHAQALVRFMAEFRMNRSKTVCYLVADAAGYDTTRFKQGHRTPSEIKHAYELMKQSPHEMPKDLKDSYEIACLKLEEPVLKRAENKFIASFDRDIKLRLTEDAEKGTTHNTLANKLLKKRLGFPGHPAIKELFQQLHGEQWEEIPSPDYLATLYGYNDITVHLLQLDAVRDLYREYLKSYAG